MCESTTTTTTTAVVVDRFYRKGKCVHTGTLQISVDTRRDFFIEKKEPGSETGEAHIIYLPYLNKNEYSQQVEND